MIAEELDHLVVYGDREHFANIAFLTGYGPRFEEALLLLGRHTEPVILVGNEGVGYVKGIGLTLESRLYQTLSLPGQARDRSSTLAAILRDYGISAGSRVLPGWK